MSISSCVIVLLMTIYSFSVVRLHRPRIRFALSLVLILAFLGSPAEAGAQSPRQVQALSIAAGVLGAATQCDDITHDEIAAVASKVAALATAETRDLAEVISINRKLMASAIAGRQTLKDGKTDCKTIEASFRALEDIVLQMGVVQKETCASQLRPSQSWAD